MRPRGPKRAALIAARLSAAVVILGNAQAGPKDEGPAYLGAFDLQDLKRLCTPNEKRPDDVLLCYYFVGGFVVGMQEEERASNKQPACLVKADLHDLINRVILNIRSSNVFDRAPGRYLTARLLENANCRYGVAPVE